VNGKVEARCSIKSEIMPVCPPTTCRVSTTTAAPVQPANVVPTVPAEITTTVPPSTTTQESVAPAPFPPSPIPPRARIEAPVEPGARPRGSQAQTTTTSSTGPLSITRPDIPTTVPPNNSALCYQRQVFNPNTYEYEWQEACD
jgi:hypothetical protein